MASPDVSSAGVLSPALPEAQCSHTLPPPIPPPPPPPQHMCQGSAQGPWSHLSLTSFSSCIFILRRHVVLHVHGLPSHYVITGNHTQSGDTVSRMLVTFPTRCIVPGVRILSHYFCSTSTSFPFALTQMGHTTMCVSFDPPASASRVPGFQLCTITPGWHLVLCLHSSGSQQSVFLSIPWLTWSLPLLCRRQG